MTNEKTEIEKLNLNSMNIVEEKQSVLLRLFPEAQTEDGKIDFDKLKLSLGELVEAGKERYGMIWPGKTECFRTIQTPSMGTLTPLISKSLKFENADNLVIEGDNLEVLKLLQKSYLGQIKVIFIDPPYNTGKEFIYPDNYTESLQTYLEYSGQVDSEGRKFGTNSDTDGRYHSRWLSMMYPRLYLARNLLKEDGVIFIAIDDHEVTNLRKLCDEIFGEENFVSHIIWQHSLQPKGYSHIFSVHHNHILCFRKSDKFEISALERTEQDNKAYSNPDNDPKGPWRTGDVRNALYRKNLIYDIKTPSGKIISPPENGWRWSKETLQDKIKTGEIIFSPDETRIIRKIYLDSLDGRAPETIWFGKDVGTTRDGSQELKDLFDDKAPFDTVKPMGLMKRAFQIAGLKDNDICLDFFSGSCSTAVSLLDFNAKCSFIAVQLPEPIDGTTPHGKAALELDLKTISDVGLERLRRFIAKNEIKSGFRVFKLSESNFMTWNQESDSKDALEKQLALHVDHVRHDREPTDILYEVLLKSGFPLTTKVETQKIGKKTVYSIASGMLLVCLEDELTLDLIKHIAEQKPERVVCLDHGFSENDQLKTNAAQIFRAKGVTSFKTV